MTWMAAHMAWIWTGWLIFLVVSFSIFEAIAIGYGGMTLSMFTWILSQKWPPIIWVMGVLAGGLTVHFFWHWNPPPIDSPGAQDARHNLGFVIKKDKP